MSTSKTFFGVSPAVFACVKSTSLKEHGTVYDPPNGDQGTATTSGTGWTVKLSFNYDPGSQQLVYTILSKTWIVPESAIWSGIADTINGCMGSVAAGQRKS